MIKKCIALITACLMLLAGCVPSGDKAAHVGQVQTVVINEVVSANRYCLTASDGSSPDWIELHNPGAQAVNLAGYGLTDDTSQPYQFTFPEIVIDAGGYLLVYCTGGAQTDTADGVLRCGFKLSREGETLALTAPGNATLQLLELPALEEDISYGRTDPGYAYFATPTPGSENGGEHNDTGLFENLTAQSDLVINEYMTNNDWSLPDAAGDRSGWVEVKNTGSASVNLREYGLTDDPDAPKKWSFPEVELPAGGLALVFLSGKQSENGELHASFRLSGGEPLLLTDARGRTVDSVQPQEPTANALGRDPQTLETWRYYPLPTPGEENAGEGFDAPQQDYLSAVYISEVKSAGGEGDWIELHNAGDTDVNLAGYGLSDDKDAPFRFIFPETVLPAGGYVVVEGRGGEGALVADFALNAAGETVCLSLPTGTVLDHMSTGVQKQSVTAGRAPGSAKRVYFTSPTKGQANATEQYAAYAQKPSFSVTGGYVQVGVSVEISAGPGESIYYTTNGAKPTASSTRYTGPVTITQTTPLRAIAVAEGKLNSEVATENYLVEDQHDIPVVCLSLNPYDFSSDEAGIYAKGAGYYAEDFDGSDFAHTKANYWQDWEREVSFEFFEADGTKGIEFPAGIKIFGQYSREEAQKSFSIHLRGKYGRSEVTYPFFRDCGVTTFKSLLLRTSGQDWKTTKLKDAFMHQAVKQSMDLDIMDYRPCAVYINGEYWGLYNLREKQNEYYVESHYDDAKKGSIDIIKGSDNVQAGSKDDWVALRLKIKEYLPWNGQTNRMNDPEIMQYVEERVDLQSFMEWIATEAFMSNTDTGNIRQFRYAGGKWRWMLFDLDWGLQANGGYKYYNYLKDIFNDNGHGSGDRFWSHMQMAIFYNDTWREQFIELYARHINTTFAPERLTALIDAMAEEIRTEMPRHIARWGKPGSETEWEKNIEDLKAAAVDKSNVAKKELQECFGLSDVRMTELFP